MGIFTVLNMQLTDINILDLLPQRPPFIMVDRLTHYDANSACTVFTVRADNMFCKNGVMEEAGLVEVIAQTCAARTGYKQLFREIGEVGEEQGDKFPCRVGEKTRGHAPLSGMTGDTVKIGVIAMIRSMEIMRCPLVGETLETTMVIEEEVFATTLVRSEVKSGGETVATCMMKLFLTDKTPDN
jgi:3-hydroxymyristoyl/3-hydroxydecanoyl-(acyl carrier protein) dehydratase